MVGGVFEGNNGDPVQGPYEPIYTISNNPLAWNEVAVGLKDYRYLRYRGPNNSYGNVAEIEFYRDGVRLTGNGFGTSGSWNNQGSTFDKAVDGNISTFLTRQILAEPTSALLHNESDAMPHYPARMNRARLKCPGGKPRESGKRGLGVAKRTRNGRSLKPGKSR
jgi:hypothetical protein